MTKVKPNNRNETKSDKSDTTSFFMKNYYNISKSKFFSVMTKVNRNNAIETKSCIFVWGIFK